MAKYKCDVCREFITESKSAPICCAGCGAEYSAWRNLEKNKIETAVNPAPTSPPSTIITPPKKEKKAPPIKTVPTYHYSPPIPPTPPTPPFTPTYTPPPKSSNLSLFFKELSRTFGGMVQCVKNNIKTIGIVSFLIFIVLSLLAKITLTFYLVVLAGLTILILIIIYSKSIRSFGIASFHKHYENLGKIFAGLVFLIMFSIIQVLFLKNNSIWSVGKDSELFDLSNNTSTNSDTSTPENETTVWDEISNFFKQLFTGSSLTSSEEYYATTRINLRVGPSGNAAIIDQIFPGEKVIFLNEKEGEWIKAKTKRLEGWLINKEGFYSKTKPNVMCVVSTNVLNVRSGPGNNYSILSQVKRHETYKFIETNDQRNWCLIEDTNGNKGWVSLKYLKIN